MFKSSIRFPLIFFVITTVWQFITNEHVEWIDNIGIFFTMFLLLILYNWSKTPYKWKKDR
ncbi:hypothetical protein D7Z54_01355 [Salibacterium salarium]|uniref:Uncharacterized protein n=1 Tax=Salibacterium salarium TaxID=284579 RepID=A0A3R9QQC2_9BACI|nr:hypothetical protein D7Z54_01355 [Salibacterium salarium]